MQRQPHPPPPPSSVHPSVSTLQWLYLDYPLATCYRRKLNKQSFLTHSYMRINKFLPYGREGNPPKTLLMPGTLAAWRPSLTLKLQIIASWHWIEAPNAITMFISQSSKPTFIPLMDRSRQHYTPIYPLHASHCKAEQCVPLWVEHSAGLVRACQSCVWIKTFLGSFFFKLSKLTEMQRYIVEKCDFNWLNTHTCTQKQRLKSIYSICEHSKVWNIKKINIYYVA